MNAINKILYLSLMSSVLIKFHIIADDEINITSVNCQSSKSLRKQLPAEPLNGVCLRDAVVHLSQTLRSTVDEELGVSSFQRIINKMEFANISSSAETKLNALVDKFNNKLRSYKEVLEYGYNAVRLILSKAENQSLCSSQMASLNVPQNVIPDTCTQIVTGRFIETKYSKTYIIENLIFHHYNWNLFCLFTSALATNLRNQDWKNLHILPVNEPSTICGPPMLAHNIGPLLLTQYCSEKNVILLLDHDMSMSESDLGLAQITAKAVIDMLLETDNVTVVGLSNTAPLFCKDGLLKATDINKFQLTRYIDGLIRTGNILKL